MTINCHSERSEGIYCIIIEPMLSAVVVLFS